MAGAHPPSYPWDQLTTNEHPSDELQRKRDAFGAYVIAAYCPYSVDKYPSVSRQDDGARLTLDWQGFVMYVDYLYRSESFIDAGRLFEIENLANGTSGIRGEDNYAHRGLINEYRHLFSDDLSDKDLMYPFGKRAETNISRMKSNLKEQQRKSDFVKAISKKTNLQCVLGREGRVLYYSIYKISVLG